MTDETTIAEYRRLCRLLTCGIVGVIAAAFGDRKTAATADDLAVRLATDADGKEDGNAED